MGKNIDKNNDVEMVFGDKIIIAGVDPNLNPSTRKDDAGRSTSETAITGSLGNTKIEKTNPVYTECDNNSDRPGGNINIVGMNGVKIEAGSGGIDLISAGNITMMPGGGICNVAATESFGCISKNVSIASTEGTNIAGGNLSVESQASSFANNVAMNGNAKINGGCFINGEAFIPHMTTQKQDNFTEPCEECEGFINPSQTFVLIPGDKTLLDASVNPMSLYLNLEFDATALIKIVTDIASAVVSGGTYNPPGPVISLPIKPLLSHIISKGMLNTAGVAVPTLKTNLIAVQPALKKCFVDTDSAADFTLPGHRHMYSGPSCTYTKSTAALYEEAKAVENTDLVKHKPNQICGTKDAFDAVVKDMEEAPKKFMNNLKDKIVEELEKPIF